MILCICSKQVAPVHSNRTLCNLKLYEMVELYEKQIFGNRTLCN